jgi:hypothetical protein
MSKQNTYILNIDGELYHYGVLGMKWGVRKGRSTEAYEKASKKLKRLDQKVDVSLKKAYVQQAKAEKKASNVYISEKRVYKADIKALKAQDKLVARADKARKWLRAMERTFSDTPESLSHDQIDLGKKYSTIILREFERTVKMYGRL